MAMKAALMSLLLTCGVFDAVGIDILAALHKGESRPKFDILALLRQKPKKLSPSDKVSQEATANLQTIMAASQQGLALAEQHHEKAVKQARDQIQSLLEKHAATLSQSIGHFNSALAVASVSLERTMNASKIVLERTAAEGDSWNSPTTMVQARLSSQISFAQSMLRQADRKRKSGLHDAESQAKSLLEDGVTKLSRKVGDISDLVQQVQAPLEEGSDPSSVPSQSVQASFVQKVGQKLDLKSAQAELLAAEKQVDASRIVAQKDLDAAFNKVEKDLASGAKAIADGLAAAQKEELETVRSPPAPPAKKLRHKKHA